mmetsp:Transcript_63748/g.137131  ORF Transcript_63748/g.137131 Transcript_63748/m.137131 type:complete len:286 (-) Transcript_63748:52-909(-)
MPGLLDALASVELSYSTRHGLYASSALSLLLGRNLLSAVGRRGGGLGCAVRGRLPLLNRRGLLAILAIGCGRLLAAAEAAATATTNATEDAEDDAQCEARHAHQHVQDDPHVDREEEEIFKGLANQALVLGQSFIEFVHNHSGALGQVHVGVGVQGPSSGLGLKEHVLPSTPSIHDILLLDTHLLADEPERIGRQLVLHVYPHGLLRIILERSACRTLEDAAQRHVVDVVDQLSRAIEDVRRKKRFLCRHCRRRGANQRKRQQHLSRHAAHLALGVAEKRCRGQG